MNAAAGRPETKEQMVVAVLGARIVNGSYGAAGAKMPSKRELAADLGVAIATLDRGYAKLREVGLIETISGSGTYVRTTQMPPPPPTLEQLAAELRELSRRVEALEAGVQP
ncbi:GntR family transcriptional regulator [Nocardia brasiliensis]|uniref:GntR family transcriptional regulator n=1 Tax=Nocardia brasiliensis TaxID=37326 RepID=UPI0024584F06|nr:GntR family transcriptional regulator [Nocardia brasiliensis]